MTRPNFPTRGPGVVFVLLCGIELASAGGLTLSEAMKAVLQNSEEAQLLTQKEAKLEAQKGELWAGALPNVQAYANVGRGGSPIDLTAFGFQSPTRYVQDAAGNLIVDTTTNKVMVDNTPQGSGPSVVNIAQNRYSYGVQVNQPIYSFGRLGLAFDVATAEVHSQSEANRRSRQQIELQTLDAFYGVLTTEARLAVLEASQRRQNQTVGFLQSNFTMGSGTRSTVLLAVSALKALEPDRIRAERDAEAARMNFNRLLGRPVNDSLALDTNVAGDLPVPVVDRSESSINSILDQRPDLASMRLQKEALRGYARGYRMQYLPSLAAQGKLGVLAYHLDDQLTNYDKNLDWQVGLGLQWTVFDGFSNSSKAHEYDADARSMELSERQARAYARIEIVSALRDAAAADTAYEAAQQARDAAAEADQLLTDDFRSGKGHITDLLSAEEGLRNAEFGLLAANYQKVRARAALRVALGEGLIEEDSK